MIGNLKPLQSHPNCELHPLIHTLLEFNLAQDILFYQHGGVDGFSRLVTHSFLYNEGIHRKATQIPFATLPLKDLRIHHQRIFVNVRIMGTAHN